jgi:hypothetical protein
MIRKTAGENWKPLRFPGWKEARRRYAVSDLGRLASYMDDLHEDGKLLRGSITTGYRSLNLHLTEGKGTIYLHREVARLFLKKTSPRQRYVVHLNHDRLDNRAANLRWANPDEMNAHQQASPAKLAYKERQASRTRGLKLTSTQVRAIKKTLADPRRRLTYRQLAEKYGVSEMTLHRIRSGENWGRI